MDSFNSTIGVFYQYTTPNGVGGDFNHLFFYQYKTPNGVLKIAEIKIFF